MHNGIYELSSPSLSTSAHDEATDEELMARIQQQDEPALEALCRRHAALLRTIISRVINNDQDVDDLIQEVLLEIWHQASHFDAAKGKALGWIVTLARRRAIDRLRRRQAYSRAAERMRLEVWSEETASDCVEDDVIASDARGILQRVIKRLPAAQREAIELTFYQGLSQREISAQTGIPLGTVKTRIELGMGKLRTLILALGGKNAWRASSRVPHEVMRVPHEGMPLAA